MNQLTKITLAWELFGEQVPKSHIAQKLEIHRETVGLWIKEIEKNPSGLTGFIDNYLSAKKGERSKRKLDGLLKNQIWRIRDENRDCCGQKIREYLNWQPCIELEEGVQNLLKNIDYWNEAPVWTPDTIAEATRDWFKYLSSQN